MFDPAMLRKLQGDLQARIEQMNTQLDAETVVGSSGGGVVKVTITGNREVKAVEIGPEAIDPDDPEMLQDLVIAAMNQGLEAAGKLHEERMSSITGGMKLPGLF